MNAPKAIGIECMGASYSYSVALAEDGTPTFAERHYTRINAYEQDRDELANRIYDLVKHTLTQATPALTVEGFFKSGGYLCVAITGITTRHDAESLAYVWDRLDFPINQCLLTGDAEVVLPTWAYTLEGAVLLVTAGSVAYANSKGNSSRVGGWGPIMGDEGGGYYIGRKALHALTWYKNNLRTPCPELARCVRKRLHGATSVWGDIWRSMIPSTVRDDQEDLEWIEYLIPYTSRLLNAKIWRYAISDLAPAVFHAAELEKRGETPSQVANAILDKSADHLAERLTKAVSHVKLSQGDNFPVVMTGGILTHNREFEVRVKEKLKNPINDHAFPPKAVYVSAIEDMNYHFGAGAALFAWQRSLATLPNVDTCKDIVARVRKKLRLDGPLNTNSQEIAGEEHNDGYRS